MRDRPVYLDGHATTPCDPVVVAAMLPYITEKFGNASSVAHAYGWEAAEAVDAARQQVASLLNAEPREIVFTSGATESNNLALKGVLPALRAKGDHIVTTAVEHRAVLDVCKRLSREGWRVTFVAPDQYGQVSAESIAAALTEKTVVVSVIAASNEVGTINPIAEIAALCHSRGIVCHTDATQAVGKIPLDLQAIPADLVSLSAHKLYGPKGIGALFIRQGPSRPRLAPLFDGGGHERGYRSGTLPVPLIVGLGQACGIASLTFERDALHTRTLRDRLQAQLLSRLPDAILNGHPAERLPNNLNLSFPGVDGEALMMAMRDVAVSSGAACTSARPEPSHVLRALGRDEALARASLRFGLGRFTTEEEVDFAAEYVALAVSRLCDSSG